MCLLAYSYVLKCFFICRFFLTFDSGEHSDRVSWSDVFLLVILVLLLFLLFLNWIYSQYHLVLRWFFICRFFITFSYQTQYLACLALSTLIECWELLAWRPWLQGLPIACLCLLGVYQPTCPWLQGLPIALATWCLPTYLVFYQPTWCLPTYLVPSLSVAGLETLIAWLAYICAYYQPTWCLPLSVACLETLVAWLAYIGAYLTYFLSAYLHYWEGLATFPKNPPTKQGLFTSNRLNPEKPPPEIDFETTQKSIGK